MTDDKNKNKKHATTVSNAADKEAQVVEIEALKAKAEELENNYKRALADYQNLEKRMVEDRKKWLLTANKDLLLRLLPVLDTLILASKHSQDQSLKVSVNQFLDILKQEGVYRIETKDKDFDPRLMEGIEKVEGEKDKVKDKIIEETRAGFMLNDNLLRPAQVRVGKGN